MTPLPGQTTDVLVGSKLHFKELLLLHFQKRTSMSIAMGSKDYRSYHEITSDTNLDAISKKKRVIKLFTYLKGEFYTTSVYHFQV